MVVSAAAVNYATVPTNVIFAQVPCTLRSTVYPVISVPVFKERIKGEFTWQLYFYKKFSRLLPHRWQLVPVRAKPPGNWLCFVDSAKVRFACESCDHGWTSMKGRVSFWCSFSNNSGVVAFRVYGQQCSICRGDAYEQPLWYIEEIDKVLSNIFHRVASLFYGYGETRIHLKRRRGKAKSPHDQEKCQACLDGVCSLRK